MTSEMLLVCSQRASCNPALTFSEKVLIDAIVNNNRIVIRKLQKINFKILIILNFEPESVIVYMSERWLAVAECRLIS